MNKIYFSPEARNDLVELEAYIREELESPQAAAATVQRIFEKVEILEKRALMGAKLSSVTDIESDYRFLRSGRYLIFYRVRGESVFIDRILYERRDYMRALFGEDKTE